MKDTVMEESCAYEYMETKCWGTVKLQDTIYTQAGIFYLYACEGHKDKSSPDKYKEEKKEESHDPRNDTSNE